MRRIFIPILIALGLVSIAAVITLTPGETGALECAGDVLEITQTTITQADYSCLAYTPTVTPLVPTVTNTPVATATNTPVPATATPMHDHAAMGWHAPGAHGNAPAHEHGDAPPAWLTAAGISPTYDHVGGTPNENGHDGGAWWKHTAFKGWAGTFNNVQWYGVFHLDFNPSGHGSRFHSYQLWLRDSTGAISHMHGWLDFGEDNNTGPNLVITCGVDSQVRPIIKVNQAGCPVTFENWYANASPAGPDIGFNINPNYFAGGDPANPATWTPTGGIRNLTRRIEFAYYGQWGDENLRGEFWTTQWGDVVSGPTDAICGTQRTYGTRSYTVACLKQVVQPTLPNIQFPGNSVQRTFVGNGVVLPN